jgi:hypothetical protein
MARTDPQTIVLALIVHDTLNGSQATDDPRLAALHAAVHAWMEGHVEGEGRAGTTTGARITDAVMPIPPFPARDDPQLAAIAAEVQERFADAELVSAVMFAAALAYEAGLAEGASCPGCGASTRMGGQVGAQVRAGRASVTLHPGRPAEGRLDPLG